MDKVNLAEFHKDETSQSGENGIIEKIFDVIGTANKVCVEFGAHDLSHLSNVAPLWMNNGWRAILIEGNTAYCGKMRRDLAAFNKQGISSVSVDIEEQYVGVEGESSLDAILFRYKVPKDIDLVSIDVDGTDYHIWKSLSEYRPRVVVIEYNGTVPVHILLCGNKDGNFFGASALALFGLAREKGYALVACTKSNMVFVLDEYADRFLDSNDLGRLFDDSGICYAMRTYEGAVVLSRKPTHGFNPFSHGGERSLKENQQVYFPDKSFHNMLALWMHEMRVRARNNPFQRGILISIGGFLSFLYPLFSWIFKNPDRR